MTNTTTCADCGRQFDPCDWDGEPPCPSDDCPSHEAPAPEPTKIITAELRADIEAQWVRRVGVQRFSPGSAKYKRAEVEFFCGAMTALVSLGYQMPAFWAVSLMAGRPIVNPPKERT